MDKLKEGIFYGYSSSKSLSSDQFQNGTINPIKG